LSSARNPCWKNRNSETFQQRVSLLSPSDPIEYENRFGPAVEAFRAFRPGYPTEVFAQILSAIPEERRERAVDLGAGTGLSAVPLCAWFREVIAVEPDPQMAAELAGKHSHLKVRNEKAEDCALPAECADLATCGTAFHWMDGPRVLGKVRKWLRPGGVLAIYNYPVPKVAGLVQEVIDREFELHWDKFRHPRLNDESYVERTFLAHHGLSDVKSLKIPNVVNFTPEEAVGFCQSTSYGSAYMRTLADPRPYLQELLAAFRRASGGRPIAADFSISMFMARKA
jgi:SAM-dependent methyltransferase